MTGLAPAPVCTALAVLVLLATHRPRRLARPLPIADQRIVQGHRRRRSVTTAIGRLARGALGRPVDPRTDRRVGRVVLAGVALALAEPLLAALWAAGCAVASVSRRRAADRRHRQRLVDELPEVVDLLRLAASSGLTIPLALDVVAGRGVGTVASALGRANAAASRGGALADALDDLVAEVGEEVRPLVRVLGGALRDGTSVVPSLERLAAEVRTDRRRAAEERARTLPVRLLFPLVACVLPAFALLTVVPLLAGALRGLPR